MGEAFHFHAKLRRKRRQLGDFGNRELAGKRHALRAQLGSRRDACCIMGVHLSRYMDMRLGQLLGEARRQPDILNDEGIGPRRIRRTGQIQCAIDFAWEKLYVQRHVYVDAPHMSPIARTRQALQREIVRVPARVELVKSQVNRICARCHCGMQAFEAACRREQLWFTVSCRHDFPLVTLAPQGLHIRIFA